MKLTVDALHGCMDGSVPPILATCALDGTPNVSFVSQMEYVDAMHVALSFQFFNKTRANILAHPFATAYITDAGSGASFRLSLHYQRTETGGTLFERMKARLAGIASQTGMQGIFHLQGADVYRVLAIESVPCDTVPPPPPRRDALTALRAASERACAHGELDRLFDEVLLSLANEFDMPHSMLLMLDTARGVLYTVASQGYPESGVGSEVSLGIGVIGVAAAQRVPIRIAYMTSEYRYTRAVGGAAQAGEPSRAEVPFPGLPAPHSQIAVPVGAGGRLLGVLYADSMEDHRFGYADEDALVVLANQLGAAILSAQRASEGDDMVAAPTQTLALPSQTELPPLRLRRYCENDTLFVDDDYLIKGVAGAVPWKLAGDYTRLGRTEFCNRELRLDPAIRLPELDDNLEARLILLSRRLRERCPAITIEKTGRGRFRFGVQRPLLLEEA